MPRIYVNGRFLTQPLTGINRFAYEICVELSKILDITLIVPHENFDSAYDLNNLKIIQYGSLHSHLWEQISLLRFLRRNHRSILISFSGIGPIMYKRKISTIHDVSFLYNKNWFSKTYYHLYKILTPLLIKTSRKILTVSEFSKSEIYSHYKKSVQKIEVIYNAVNTKTFKNFERHSIPKTVLTVGSIDPRKNLKNLIAAFNSEILSDVQLLVIGNANRIFGTSQIPDSKYDNVKFLGRVSDEELSKAYSEASLFVSSSLYEGFGIPPLEALSAGCPIALSDIPVYREVFGDSAVYFNPESPESIAKCISENIDVRINDNSRLRIINRYSWKISANKVANIIKSIQ